MKKNALALAAAVGLAMTAGSAFASASSFAQMQNVRIVLTDLDPNDGITPSLSINFGSQPYINGGIGSYGPEFSQDSYAHLGKKPDSFLQDMLQTSYATSIAYMVGANNVSGINYMIASGVAGSSPLGFGEYGALASNYTLTQFSLSANTAITITVDAQMNASTTFGYDPKSGKGEHAASHVYLLFDGYDDNGNSLLSEAYQELSLDTATNASWQGTMSVTFTNLSTHNLIGNFYGEVGVGGNSILPVPEPETYAMLIAGLAAVGGVVSRRRKAADA